jgi:hypothetical protein
MIPLSALWLPILLSAVFVFIASSVIHMALPWHKKDYLGVPQADQVAAALRPHAIPPGDYMLPKPDTMQQLRSPEYLDRVAKGPVIVMTVMPNVMMPIGPMLAKWFVYIIGVVFIAAAVASTLMPRSADSHLVVHTIGVISFLGFAAALWQMAIWYRRSWVTTLKSTIDGLVYAAITAATFAWLWPR